MSGESTGPPIPLTSTGPFAPLNDLSDDEFLELMRVGNDLQAARMGLLLSERPARQEKVQDLVALEDLEGQIDAALGRLSNSGPLLSTILTKIGDNGVNLALTQAVLKDTTILTTLLEKAGKAGGITALLEDRISLFPDAFEAERANVKFIFDTFRKDELGAGQPMPASDTHSAFLCALGAAEMTTGAGWIGVAVVETIITGGLGAPKGAVLAGAGSALLGSGTALVSSQC